MVVESTRVSSVVSPSASSSVSPETTLELHPVARAEEQRLLASLALAMVTHPRATLQELARAVGLSKATLYRFCRTREQLVERLLNYSMTQVSTAIEASRLTEDHPLEALQRLTVNSLACRECSAFLMMYYWQDGATDLGVEAGWEPQMDAFFLRGQQTGVFRIDMAAPVLTELWIAIFTGMVDAERRGRVARAGLAALVVQAFLQGAAPPV